MLRWSGVHDDLGVHGDHGDFLRSGMERRNFLFSSGAAALAATLGSGFLDRLAAQNAPPIPTAVPNPAQFTDEDRYWAEVRKLFLIPADEVYLNNGTVGTSP